MNKLQALTRTSLLTRSVFLQQNSTRTAAVVNPNDWLPGPRPETEEQRIQAAKKYNLLPEEYECQPDDGFATGDYPHLSGHHDDKDPFYPWDYPLFRVNFGEALPNDFAITTYDKFYSGGFANERFTWWQQVLWLGAFVVPFSAFSYYVMWKYRYYYPHFDSAKPKPGVVHYEYPTKK